jgi:hypothetical protein
MCRLRRNGTAALGNSLFALVGAKLFKITSAFAKSSL